MLSEIKIVKRTKPLYLRELDEAYGDIHLDVWVNAPRGIMAQYDDIYAEMQAIEKERAKLLKEMDEAKAKALAQRVDVLNAQTFAFYAELWGQDTEEVRQFYEQTLDDPAIWGFVTSKTWELIAEYREYRKKGLKTPK